MKVYFILNKQKKNVLCYKGGEAKKKEEVVMCREDYIYKSICEAKYFTGIFNAENDVLERPWLYRCYKEFRDFKTEGLGIWESYYQPGLSKLDIGLEKGDVWREYSGSYIGDQGDFIETCGLTLEVGKGFGLFDSSHINIVPDFVYKNYIMDERVVDKGVFLGDFVVSQLGSTAKVEKMISMTRIHGLGDLLPEDRININKGCLDFNYNMEKKIYNIDYLDNLTDKKLLSLIEVDEPLRVIRENDYSYLNVGYDTVVGLEEKGVSQGYFGLDKIVYEMNVLPASGWLINFCFFVGGAVAVGTAVWLFYVGLGKLKEYIEMSGIWDPDYKYWEILYDLEKEKAGLGEGFKVLKEYWSIVKELNWTWLEGII